VFGWIDKLLDRWATAFARRGQTLMGVEDRLTEERRTAVRTAKDAASEAMVHAEQDRLHGADREQSAAISAANRASATVHEVDDLEARQLVIEWKRQFDAIPKGWKEPYEHNPPGYPEPAWGELRKAADEAIARLGEVLRELMGPKK
jgi:hypothetical protein